MASSSTSALQPQAWDAVPPESFDRPFTADVEKTAESDLETMVASERGSTRGRDEKGAGEGQEEEDSDPDVVNWDGPNDPENPMNWTDKKKWTGILVLSVMTLVT